MLYYVKKYFIPKEGDNAKLYYEYRYYYNDSNYIVVKDAFEKNKVNLSLLRNIGIIKEKEL